jgi:hypothetical protein
MRALVESLPAHTAARTPAPLPTGDRPNVLSGERDHHIVTPVTY